MRRIVCNVYAISTILLLYYIYVLYLYIYIYNCMFVSALPDPTCNSEKSANGGNKQILLLLSLLLHCFLGSPCFVQFDSVGVSTLKNLHQQ